MGVKLPDLKSARQDAHRRGLKLGMMHQALIEGFCQVVVVGTVALHVDSGVDSSHSGASLVVSISVGYNPRDGTAVALDHSSKVPLTISS